MPSDSPRVFPAGALRGLVERLFAAAGCGPEDAAVAADVLLEADLRGYGTHGLLRLPMMIRRIQSGMIDPRARPRVTEEREASALVDAGRALGPVGVLYGARLAARKAARAGCCAVGVVNADHICMAGYYAEHIAREGLAGLLMGVVQPLVHPLGGGERVLGTNPLAIALPGEDGRPLLLDFATSEIAFGSVLRAKARGERLPPGAAVGPDGRPTTDPAEAAAGAVAPFGGHRGYGLSLFMGLLAGPLLGAKVGKPLGQAVREGRYDKGELLIAIDPAAFGDPGEFRRAAAVHIREVKGSRKAPGAPEIRIPGERGFAERERRLREGVPIDAAVWAEVASLAGELKVSLPG
ncbi:MAG: Ldh family oxidoreductase [Candidatus Tectomicrobia bacterium]|uniref:Ldh family oxidoreductase n=1 Tax=Tectimicrobiota bacterium TaxID=2528274 RepID=A0A932MMW6_UNCTE|nr:Ldh family oxidoreductase [Candidatus Tectomicrobia bacterium]